MNGWADRPASLLFAPSRWRVSEPISETSQRGGHWGCPTPAIACIFMTETETTKRFHMRVLYVITRRLRCPDKLKKSLVNIDLDVRHPHGCRRTERRKNCWPMTYICTLRAEIVGGVGGNSTAEESLRVRDLQTSSVIVRGLPALK